MPGFAGGYVRPFHTTSARGGLSTSTSSSGMFDIGSTFFVRYPPDNPDVPIEKKF
jgi:hypothetical protein